MSEKSLEERTVVYFPRAVGQEEAHKIIEYITKDLGNSCKICGSFSGYFSAIDGETVERYISEISGNFVQGTNTANFYFLRDTKKEKLDLFAGLKFQIVPGYELEEHREGEIKEWDKVSNIIEKYFKGRSECQ